MNATYFGSSPVARFARGGAVLHVHFVGQSFDVPLTRLDICRHTRDRQIRLAVARFLSLPDGALESYAIVRHADGNLTIRPAAVLH